MLQDRFTCDGHCTLLLFMRLGILSVAAVFLKSMVGEGGRSHQPRKEYNSDLDDTMSNGHLTVALHGLLAIIQYAILAT